MKPAVLSGTLPSWVRFGQLRLFELSLVKLRFYCIGTLSSWDRFGQLRLFQLGLVQLRLARLG